MGNRPQFIKLAPIYRKFVDKKIEQIIIHTGQHYDSNMSDIFFDELNLPKPQYNLQSNNLNYGIFMGKVISQLYDIYLSEKPKALIVYGDTNTTLAATIANNTLNIPMFHVEAGPRTFNMKNIEERNRVVVDHLSDYLFVPDQTSYKNLINEGIDKECIICSGDVMYDEFMYCVSQRKNKNLSNNYILMTLHRKENTDSKKRMSKIISFVTRIHYHIILPLHPRTKKMLKEYGLYEVLSSSSNIEIIEPVGYLEMVNLIENCTFIISDSGGLSKEAAFAGKKCFFPLMLDVWPDLETAGYINRVDIEDEVAVESVLKEMNVIIENGLSMERTNIFGQGNASEIIVKTVLNKIYKECN